MPEVLRYAGGTPTGLRHRFQVTFERMWPARTPTVGHAVCMSVPASGVSHVSLNLRRPAAVWSYPAAVGKGEITRLCSKEPA